MHLQFLSTRIIRTAFVIAIVGLAWINITACENFHIAASIRTDTTNTGTTTLLDTTVCFQRDVLPIFLSNCATSGCHDTFSHSDGYILSDYANIVKKGIVVGSPSRSTLYTIMLSSSREIMPPRPQSPLSSAQTDIISRWIAQGARNTDCSTAPCDTVAISFTKHILPILDRSCVSCHSGPSANAGIILTNYPAVVQWARSGALLGVITKSIGYSPMPPNSTLDACSLAQIRAWINQGMPN